MDQNITPPENVITRVTKNPKKQAAGRAGALARKAKLLEALQASKQHNWTPWIIILGAVGLAAVVVTLKPTEKHTPTFDNQLKTTDPFLME